MLSANPFFLLKKRASCRSFSQIKVLPSRHFTSIWGIRLSSKCYSTILVYLFSFIFLTQNTLAQEQKAQNRLGLSGGGAKDLLILAF
jgi:hypothetical protein